MRYNFYAGNMHLHRIYIAAIYEKKEEPWEITCRSSKNVYFLDL